MDTPRTMVSIVESKNHEKKCPGYFRGICPPVLFNNSIMPPAPSVCYLGRYFDKRFSHILFKRMEVHHMLQTVPATTRYLLQITTILGIYQSRIEPSSHTMPTVKNPQEVLQPIIVYPEHNHYILRDLSISFVQKLAIEKALP